MCFKAIERMVDKLDSEIKYYWDAAWMLHVRGFHEGKLDIDYVVRELEDIEKLVKLR